MTELNISIENVLIERVACWSITVTYQTVDNFPIYLSIILFHFQTDDCDSLDLRPVQCISDIDDSIETIIRSKVKGSKDRQGSPGESTLSSSSQTLSSKLIYITLCIYFSVIKLRYLRNCWHYTKIKAAAFRSNRFSFV